MTDYNPEAWQPVRDLVGPLEAASGPGSLDSLVLELITARAQLFRGDLEGQFRLLHEAGISPWRVRDAFNQERLEGYIRSLPAVFGLRPFPGRFFRLEKNASFVRGDGTVMLYTYIWDVGEGRWSAFSKGTPSEVDAAFVPAPPCSNVVGGYHRPSEEDYHLRPREGSSSGFQCKYCGFEIEAWAG